MFSLNPNAIFRGLHSVWTFTKREVKKYNFLLNPISKTIHLSFWKTPFSYFITLPFIRAPAKEGVSCGCLRNVDEQKQMIGHGGQKAAWCRHTHPYLQLGAAIVLENCDWHLLKRVSIEIVISSLL